MSRLSEYGAGLPFLTRSWFEWSVFGRSVRLLGVDIATGRVLDAASSSKSHTTRSSYRAFDRAPRIATPEDAVRGR